MTPGAPEQDAGYDLQRFRQKFYSRSARFDRPLRNCSAAPHDIDVRILPFGRTWPKPLWMIEAAGALAAILRTFCWLPPSTKTTIAKESASLLLWRSVLLFATVGLWFFQNRRGLLAAVGRQRGFGGPGWRDRRHEASFG